MCDNEYKRHSLNNKEHDRHDGYGLYISINFLL